MTVQFTLASKLQSKRTNLCGVINASVGNVYRLHQLMAYAMILIHVLVIGILIELYALLYFCLYSVLYPIWCKKLLKVSLQTTN